MLGVLLAATAFAGDIKPPKREPAGSTEAHAAVIREGIALHDRGEYDAAIAKYESVLAESPDDVLALYELAFTLFTKKDYQKALDTAYRGAEYKSDYLGRFYDLIGSCLDDLGRSTEAVSFYNSAAKILPNEGMLHFNLAITYLRLKQPGDARKSLKAAAAASPSFPSTHYVLAMTLYNDDYKVPALLCALRYLTLDPSSKRAANALEVATQVLQGGVSSGKNPNEINITVNPDIKTDEGDFGAAELIIGLAKAAGSTEKNKNKSEAELLVDQIETIVSVLSELDSKKNKSSFFYKYYVPYFVAMKKQDLIEPFVYYIFQKSGIPGITEWLEVHDDRVQAFKTWSDRYPWPRNVAK